MTPPGPSTKESLTGTDDGATGSGARSTTFPSTERTTDGSADEDQEYSTVPSGRAVAPVTEPAGVGRSSTVPSRPTRCSVLRPRCSATTSSALPSAYQSAVTSPSIAMSSRVTSPETGSQSNGNGRPRSSCSPSTVVPPGAKPTPCRPSP